MCKRFLIRFFILIFCINFSLIAEPTFSDAALESAKASNILVAITAFYHPDRLQYLAGVISSLSTLPKAEIIVVTNTFNEDELLALQDTCHNALLNKGSGTTVSVRSYHPGTHPYHLTWCHKPIISDEFVGRDYSHFIYLEDDMTFDFTNLCYFIEYRELFRDRRLLPSFLRVEYHSGFHDFVNTDNLNRVNICEQPYIDTKDFWFVNISNPYTACFILDQELAVEYVQSRSFDREKSYLVNPWNVRERAAMGLCFENVPPTFQCRYVVAVSKQTGAAPECVWVRHLPNTYANIPNMGYGKIRMSELFMPFVCKKPRSRG